MKFLKDFELFGCSDHQIYTDIQESFYLRNRIHIFNYFDNFEDDEEVTFNQERLEMVASTLTRTLRGMEKYYSRPFESGQENYWLERL